MKKIGTVSLVGAGPGDPGLITVAGMRALRSADVIIFDRLAPSKLLQEVKADGELISAAKAPGFAGLTQTEINDLLVDKARQGLDICRLKGGDPFVFGRGGEEALVLKENRIPFVVIPGVTSALGAPSYAGIPVTHRDVSQSVTFVTGSDGDVSARSKADWQSIARNNGTLVILMGARNMQQITDRLIEYGRDGSDPAAAIHRGTTYQQQVIVATLDEIAHEVSATKTKAPIALVVGQVVNLREHMGWFDQQPLFGKRVLVTRARSQTSRLASGLSALGAKVIECPAIRSEAVDCYEELDATLRMIGNYEWLAFASPNGVARVFDRAFEIGLDARAFTGCKFAAVGSATAEALRARGIIADLLPETFTAEGLVDAFDAADASPKTAIVFKSDIGRETLPVGLRALGAKVDEVVAYRTIIASESTRVAKRAVDVGVDITTFTSSSTVKNLMRMLDENVTGINRSVVACMGPKTADTAKSFGIRVDIVPEEQSINGILSAIENHFTAIG